MAALGVILCWSSVAGAQGEISGRVTAADSSRSAVAGAQAVIPRLDRVAVTDSSGRFRLKDLPPGEHLIFLRAIGFRAESSLVWIDRDEVVSWDVALRPATTILPERRVTDTARVPVAKTTEFIERMKAGVGHFVSRDQLVKAEGGVRQTGDLLSLVPGVRVKRGGNRAWIASGRAVNAGGCAFCGATRLNRADSAAGARAACYMDVYVDGAMVFDSAHPDYGLFDVNTVPPDHIEGIEIYTSAAQIPAKYNRTAGGCGVILIWMR